MGKLTVVKKAISYALERNYFKNGVKTIDLEEITSLKSFRERIRIELGNFEDDD